MPKFHDLLLVLLVSLLVKSWYNCALSLYTTQVIREYFDAIIKWTSIIRLAVKHNRWEVHLKILCKINKLLALDITCTEFGAISINITIFNELYIFPNTITSACLVVT